MEQGSLMQALVLATLAGASIPVGAALTWFEHWLPEQEDKALRHFVLAFGGGALVSAIALVLVPEGVEMLATGWAVALFGLGGLVFMLIDRVLAQSGSQAAMFLAMLLDYVPEALALGALLTAKADVALLMAAMIALQNLPEGFNAFREMTGAGMSRGRVMAVFMLMVPIGPLAAWVGLAYLSDAPGMLGAVMLFSSGGILYLLFQDIAPRVPLERHWVPGFGAVAGFMLGLGGYLATG